jgi:vWA-MoxR associated protein C-terminal domain
LRADSYFSLGLTFPPLPGGQHVDLAEVLDTGAAIMVWPRRHCVHPTGLPEGAGRCSGDLFKQEICRRLAGRPLSDLPQIVWEMRKEQRPGGRSEAALLWDNPAHWPGASEFHFDWPQ